MKRAQKLRLGFGVIGLAAAALIATQTQANIFANAGVERKEATLYAVEAKGSDVRVYEWSPESKPGFTCVMAFSNSGPVGLDCFQ